MIFAQRYDAMANEAKTMSKLVQQNIPQYDKTILKSAALIMDDFWTCVLCYAVFVIAIGGSCGLVCACTLGAGYLICLSILELSDYWSQGVSYVCDTLLDCMGESSPSYAYVSSASYYVDGGTVDNVGYVTGSSNDGNFAHIHCSDYPDMAQIIGTMSQQGTHGKIEIYGKDGSGGYYSDLYVYVSSDGNNWNYVGMKTITNTSPYWIDFGYVTTCFSYIAIVGYDSANSVCLYIDCVRVMP
jgi:hypothetical protein